MQETGKTEEESGIWRFIHGPRKTLRGPYNPDLTTEETQAHGPHKTLRGPYNPDLTTEETQARGLRKTLRGPYNIPHGPCSILHGPCQTDLEAVSELERRLIEGRSAQ